MYKEWSYQEVKDNAEAIKKLGMDEIYLSEGEYPWEITEDMREGGSHRLDISTSVWFSGIEPTSGIPIRWSFDIENRSANGKGYYEIDIKGCKDTIKKLPIKVRAKFLKYLSDCADAVEKNAQEYQRIMDNEMTTVRILRSF